ncbi:hypothetical protein AOL_s00097g303 [Orbilia oligospora ATCC 24927]|uniref:Cation/H+ exchanger transmembrane domain-containing protein n=1 Tax=Arthrobotrys oligospora (strain ATCC 24927 / CBS 115.81 / DSM 1491) TaxID=756982 RepID=G1XIX6_ARTOA|nr:hypothetical protein AOL_s00097g303 [Orbilia oligospora ATCC 24927]EGX46877.1 hypothetical protein AOL_s00097g303 [Orbilia oligospora ATCC 24927]
MPNLIISEFNIVCTVLGGFVLAFGLVSFFVKERLYLSEALIALLMGVALGPYGAHIIRPLSYARDNSEENLDSINLAFSRLVLGVQLVLAGVQLPKKYLIHEWKSLGILLGPVMTVMWLVSGTIIYGLIPGLTYVQSLAIGACITPTDPILSNTIVKGKFADKHIPVPLQRIIIAESGANDGLGYPFLFLALYIYRYAFLSDRVGHGVSLFFTETISYTILLSVVYGGVVGWLAKDLLHLASERKLVDRESFLVFAIALALFIVGTCGMIGTDDVLACFIAGNAFTLDDWFRLETLDDSLQPTIDMLLNITIFLWFGAVAPWSEFGTTSEIPIGRLLGMAILILLLRRPPIILLLHKYIPRINNLREAAFAGYFGPIGVSAIFYLYVTIEFLRQTEKLPLDESQIKGVHTMMTATKLVVWFSVIASVIVHGITVPVIKLGNAIPLSISRSVSRVTGNLSGLGGFVSRGSSGGRSSVSTLPLPDPVLTDQRADVRVISMPSPVAQVTGDIERGKTLSWDENLERGREERMAMGL